MKAMLLDPLPLALLHEHALDPRPDRHIEGHVTELGLRIRNREQPNQLAARLSDRDGLRALPDRCDLVPSLRSIDKIPQLLSKTSVPAACLLRSDLEGDRIEPLLVTIGVAPDQRLELICGCHAYGSP